MTAPALLVLRLVLAVVLVAHGAHTLFGTFGGPGVGPGGLRETATHFNAIGLNPGPLMALLGGIIQLSAGVLIAGGLITRWASLAMLGYLGIVIWKEHAPWGFFLNWVGDQTRGNGMEYAILIAGALVCLLLAGAGDWSLDGQRSKSAAARASGRARLRSR